MTRRFRIALALVLAFPVAALAGLIVEQELLRRAPEINVPLRGVDPRDLLRGRYLIGDLDWSWAETPPSGQAAGPGRLCLAPDTASASTGRYEVRLVPLADAPDPAGCRIVLRGWFTPGSTVRSAGFIPDGIGGDYRGQIRLYVPEAEAGRLERILVERPGAVSVDLAARPDGTAAIIGLRLDGRPFGR